LYSGIRAYAGHNPGLVEGNERMGARGMYGNVVDALLMPL